MPKLSLDDLDTAMEYASFPEGEAWVNSQTGEIILVGDGVDEAPPKDLYTSDHYIEVPDKREFDLGKPLALDFARQYMEDDFQRVYDMFRKHGAYGNFKNLLAQKELLETWYEYEKEATEQALKEWCEEVGIAL